MTVFSLQYCQFPTIWSQIWHHCVVYKAKLVTVLLQLIALHVTKYTDRSIDILRGTKTFLDPRILSTKYTECSMCVLCDVNRPDILLAYAVGTIAVICDLRRLQLGRFGELIRRALLAPGCCLLSAKYTKLLFPLSITTISAPSHSKMLDFMSDAPVFLAQNHYFCTVPQ